MRCVSGFELAVVDETLELYDLTAQELAHVYALVEQRAMDTSLPFKPYSAAHTAASQVMGARK